MKSARLRLMRKWHGLTMKLFKAYWDIISGIAAGILLAVIAELKLEAVQLYYSIIILMLVCIGGFRIIKQEIDKKRTKGDRHTLIDGIVDGQKPIKAISLAQAPTKEGEKLGRKIIILWGVTKRLMEKIKVFFEKFKGYILTIALAILTLIEMCGGYINAAFGGVLVIGGIEVLPMVTLALTVLVGILSNGYTKEQREKIKALFTKSTTNELVTAEIRKAIKEKTAELTQSNKALTVLEHELANLESELETLESALQAKKEMHGMVPQLATDEDVKAAAVAVVECRNKVTAKNEEIAAAHTKIDELTTMIAALKSQL